MRGPQLKKNLRNASGWLLSAAWAVVIFRMSAVPGSDIPSRFGNLAHFGEYAILAGLLYVALARTSYAERALTAIASSSAYALTDELHQAFTPGRMPDPADWLRDTTGAMAAVAILLLAGWLWRRRR